MERIEVQGEWWLPDNRGHIVPGTLVIDDDLIELSLFGVFQDQTETAVETENPDGSTTVRTIRGLSLNQGGIYPRIQGSANGRAYTLEDCFQVHRGGMFSGGLETQRITAHSAFRGIYLGAEDALKFSEIVIGLEGLALFVQRSGLSDTPQTEEVDGKVRSLGHTVSLTTVPTEEFKCLNGSTCKLVHMRKVGGTDFVERRVTQDFVFHVQFPDPQPLDELLTIASHLQDLVTIATGRRAAFTRISLHRPDAAHARDGLPPILVSIEMFAKWVVKPDGRQLRPHQVVFTLADFGGGDGISRWLTVADKYASSLSRVMISRYSDSTYASDSLLNSAAALEGYDRDKNGKQTGKDGYLINRFRRSITQAGDLFVELVGDTETFAERLKKQRDAVAHHSSGVEGSTAQVFLGRAAAWLFLLCLLRDADAPEAVFVKIKDRDDWQWLKEHVAGVLTEAAKPSKK